jgi:tripeptide aminopeptidase
MEKDLQKKRLVMPKKGVARHLIDLVSVYSPSGGEEIFAEYLAEKLRELADVVVIDGFGNVYARVEGEGEPLFFAAHMDTVEPGKGIKPRITVDKYLVSDGTTILGADNKATIAVYLSLLEDLREKNEKLEHRPLEFVFTKSEETGNYGAINFDYKLLRAKRGYCFDAVAPVGTIITASPYYERIDVKLIGKAAHASKPEAAKGVLGPLKELLENIRLGRISNTTICNIGKIEVGVGRNTIPGGASIEAEIRSYVEEDLRRVLDDFLVVIQNAAKTIDVEISHETENPGYYHCDKTVKTEIARIESCMSKIAIKPVKAESMAVSDANIFNNMGLVCINLGDGVEGAHSKEERIAIASMEKNLELCKKLVTQ